MWEKQKVYVVRSWYADQEDSLAPLEAEEHFAETYAEAEKLKEELLDEGVYEDVLISDEPEVREVWIGKSR